MGLQVHTKFQRNRPNRYRVTASGTLVGNGCARAHVQMHSTNDLWKALFGHTNLNTIGQAVSEIQKRGVGVFLHQRTCGDAPPVITA